MSRMQIAGKPKVSFKAPTYFIGGSNLPYTAGWVYSNLNIMRLVIMTFLASRRIINNYMIERIGKIIFTIKYFSPPKVSLKS